MSFRVQEIQETPNPNARKFLLDRPIVDHPTSFFNAAAAKGNGLAERLFAIPGVCSLLLLNDFITINKAPEARWQAITPVVKDVLAQD